MADGWPMDGASRPSRSHRRLPPFRRRGAGAVTHPTTTAGCAKVPPTIIGCEGVAMAKTLVRPSLYDEDFLAWGERQAALLRASRLDQLDLDNLAEELDTMGRSEWSELESRLEVLLMHVLMWDCQPARRSQSWKATIREQRNAIRRLMRRSPSLKLGLEAMIAGVYLDALGRAVDETGLRAADFPDRLPYGVDEVLQSEPDGHRSRRP